MNGARLSFISRAAHILASTTSASVVVWPTLSPQALHHSNSSSCLGWNLVSPGATICLGPDVLPCSGDLKKAVDRVQAKKKKQSVTYRTPKAPLGTRLPTLFSCYRDGHERDTDCWTDEFSRPLETMRVRESWPVTFYTHGLMCDHLMMMNNGHGLL